jgi:hypothetical protein
MKLLPCCLLLTVVSSAAYAQENRPPTGVESFVMQQAMSIYTLAKQNDDAKNQISDLKEQVMKLQVNKSNKDSVPQPVIPQWGPPSADGK